MQKLDPDKRRSQQINAYSTQEEKEIIHRAAAIQGVRPTRFVANAAYQAAKEVLKEEEVNQRG